MAFILLKQKGQGKFIGTGIDSSGEDLWQDNQTYYGDYNQMINTPTTILIDGNFTAIDSYTGCHYTVSAGTNAYMISLSMQGNLQNLKCYVPVRLTIGILILWAPMGCIKLLIAIWRVFTAR